jgi:HEAT repeat protein
LASRKLEERLDQLKQLRRATPDDSLIATVRKSLDDRSNLIVAEAARLAGEHHLSALIPDVLRAFDRLFEDPVKTDSKCWGKTAIAKALTSVDYSESAAFIRGAQHVQMEPVWGGQEDTALQLRATCVLALVQCTDLSRVDLLRRLVDALVDPGDPVRIEAVRAIAQVSGDEGGLLLRLKAHSGDRRSAVTGYVFDALLGLEGDSAVGFVGRFRESVSVEARDEAALALGSSRLQSAVNLLITTCGKSRDHEFRAILMRSLSSSRQTSALDFLIDLVKTGATRDSTEALDALQLHGDSPEIQKRIEDARANRKASDG